MGDGHEQGTMGEQQSTRQVFHLMIHGICRGWLAAPAEHSNGASQFVPAVIAIIAAVLIASAVMRPAILDGMVTEAAPATHFAKGG